ncbi:Transmembrane protein 72 [Dissostichus eleginoides]|uniref:Transmembrane protein 72 n=1 Tax=Dissostichus eleginoides TaxID=100907 RepID=A0AAD9CSI4_DISEL|nr:Transmembrane protein 72 [Dissostichus eleginoides]
MKGEETKPGRVQGKFSNAALTHPLTPPRSQPRPGAAAGGGESNMSSWGSLSDAPSSLFVHQQSVDSQLPL